MKSNRKAVNAIVKARELRGGERRGRGEQFTLDKEKRTILTSVSPALILKLARNLYDYSIRICR